ncbi:MAG: hypothetical protein HFI33_02705 [Lachnospiraceae bacterium]|nr:hypothetical protein [Lachnospiraceae bacterium]
MIGKFGRKDIYKPDPSSFGGIIYPSDFHTDFRGKNSSNGSSIANRIAWDQKFDEQCKKQGNKLKEKYK